MRPHQRETNKCHTFKLIWEPETQEGMINSSIGWLDVSGHHDVTAKYSLPRAELAEFSKMAVLLLFFFWCINDQCGFTFDQGDSLIISWKLRDKAFWSILVCSRFGKLCVRVAVFRSHKCYPTNIIFSNGTETSFDDGKARGWLIRLAKWNENTIL